MFSYYTWLFIRANKNNNSKNRGNEIYSFRATVFHFTEYFRIPTATYAIIFERVFTVIEI